MSEDRGGGIGGIVRPERRAQCGQKAVKSEPDGSEFIYKLFFPHMY